MQLKKILIAAVSALAAGALVTGCGTTTIDGEGSAAGDSPTKDSAATPQVTLGLTYIPNVQFAPFYVAQEQNLFRFGDQTMSVELRHHGADEGLFNALLSGKEDAVVAFGDEAVQAVSQGMELSVIGILYHKYPAVAIAKAGSGIQGWGDLKGKVVGLPGKYGSSWFAFQAGIAAAGLTLDEVEVAEIGYTQQAQLSTDKVDAVIGFSNNDLVRFQLAGMETVSFGLPQDTPLVGAAIVTTQEYAAQHRHECDALVNGMAAAATQLVADPAVAIAATKQHDETLSDPVALRAAQAVAQATNELIALPAVTSQSVETIGKAAVPSPAQFKKMISFLDSIGALGTAVEMSALDDAGLQKLVGPWEE